MRALYGSYTRSDDERELSGAGFAERRPDLAARPSRLPPVLLSPRPFRDCDDGTGAGASSTRACLDERGAPMTREPGPALQRVAWRLTRGGVPQALRRDVQQSMGTLDL